MKLETVVLIITMFAVGYLYVEKILKKETTLPELEEGERFVILKKGESNLTIKRIGSEVIATDEEGAEIALKTTRQ